LLSVLGGVGYTHNEERLTCTIKYLLIHIVDKDTLRYIALDTYYIYSLGLITQYKGGGAFCRVGCHD